MKNGEYDGYCPELLAELGHATIDKIYHFYDQPCLFTCVNKDYKRYLVVLWEEHTFPEPDVWLCASIQPTHLKDLEMGALDLRDAFLRLPKVKLISTAQVREVDPATLTEDLPAEGVTLKGGVFDEADKT